MFHNGSYTIQNMATGAHRTYRIKTWTPKDGHPTRVLELMTGSDNQNDYTGIAFLNPDGVKVWNKYRNTESELHAKFFWRVVACHELLDQYDVLLEKRCIVCNRKLTNPASIQSGIGPECANRDSFHTVAEFLPLKERHEFLKNTIAMMEKSQ